MPKWLVDVLSNGWTYTIGGTVIAAAIVGIWASLRRAIARAFTRAWNRWFKGLRLTREARTQPVPDFVEDPRWDIRQREENKQIYGLKNLGGVALHVRIRPESDEVVVVGKVDWERVEAGAIVPFGLPKLYMDGMAATWMLVSCKNEAGEEIPIGRVKIPGLLDI